MKQFLEIRFSDDMKALFVFLHAGDGAGVYDVVWVLRKNGSHTRFTDSGGDCFSKLRFPRKLIVPDLLLLNRPLVVKSQVKVVEAQTPR